MTDTTQHPEALAFCWATELAMTQQPVTLSVTEAREVSAGMQRLHTENATIRAGYAAARLEIQSLQARIKAMAEEHADELMVAHLDGRMRAAQPAGAQQPGAIYAVYAELPDERAAFEARFPVPGGVSWNGSEYVVKDDYLNSYRCDRFVGQWAAWQARASHGQAPAPAQAAPAAVAGPSEFPHEQMDAVALARYKVVPSHESVFYRHAVVAGDGSQQLYIGREAECQNMARKFAGAFLDGAFAFHSMLAAAQAGIDAVKQWVNQPDNAGAVR